MKNDKNKDTNNKKPSKLKTAMALGGVALFGAGVIGTPLFLFDAQKRHFANMGQGIPLIETGAHMKAGTHNVIIPEQFYETMSYRKPESSVEHLMKGLKEAYNTLNQYNSKIKFNLCTTSDLVSYYYDIPMLEQYKYGDITLCATEAKIDNDDKIFAQTIWHRDTFTYETAGITITFRKKHALDAIYNYSNYSKFYAAKNSIAYSLALHETMHAMGIDHIDDETLSIMYPYVTAKSPKDLTDYDIALLDKYNVQFYGAEPSLKTSTEDLTKNLATYSNVENELEM